MSLPGQVQVPGDGTQISVVRIVTPHIYRFANQGPDDVLLRLPGKTTLLQRVKKGKTCDQELTTGCDAASATTTGGGAVLLYDVVDS